MQAFKDFNKAIELDSIDTENYLSGGQEYKFRAEHYFWRGKTYYLSGKYDQAIEDFNKAIDLDSTDADFYYFRGQLHHNKKEYVKSYFDANKAFELNPQDQLYLWLRNDSKARFSAKSYYFFKIKNDLNQADKYFKENRLIEALNLYKKILESDPEAKEFLGKDTMIRVNNIIMKYKKIF